MHTLRLLLATHVSDRVEMLVVLYDRVLRRVDTLRRFSLHQIRQHLMVDVPAKVAGNELRDDAICVLVIARARIADLTKQASIRAVLCDGTDLYLKVTNFESAAGALNLERLALGYDSKIGNCSLNSSQADIS